MRVPAGKVSRAHHIICPFCESGELVLVGPGFARCNSCELPLLGSTLETLREIVGLSDVLGAHACECGHPEMRRLPDGVYHCPACGSEVLPIEVRSAQRWAFDGRLHRAASGISAPLEPTRRASA
jgi:ribosomal protein L37AE/L43A